jgi:hypothetical protein
MASQADCDKVASWQRNNGIKPAAGYAGPTTYGVMKRKVSALSRQSYCPSYSRVVCVDLTSQMMWISQYGKRVWGPFAIRSGRDGYETRTTTNRGGYCPSYRSTGTLDYCKIFRRVLSDYSSVWDTPMPYAMYFDGGEAFHTSDRSFMTPWAPTAASTSCRTRLPGYGARCRSIQRSTSSAGSRVRDGHTSLDF